MADGGVEPDEFDNKPRMVANADPIPDKFKSSERWALFEYVNDGGKWGKRPVAPWFTGHGYPAKGFKDNLTDFERAEQYIDLTPYEIEQHVGVPDEALAEFGLFYHLDPEPSDDGIIFIDLDDVRDPETGTLHRTAIGFLELADSYAQVSVSGTGIHIFLEGRLPRGVKTVQSDLPDSDMFPDAEIEIYDSDRLTAMTGDHIEDTPQEVNKNEELVDEIVEEFYTGDPETAHDVEQPKKPAITREEIRQVESTAYMKDVYDAIKLTEPGDIRLDSTLTEERGDGTKSYDPSWEQSESGTRLAAVDDGWVYRAGMEGLDALQLVALEEGIITDPTDYPSGDQFKKAVEELRRRGGRIPEFDRTKRTLSTAAIMPEIQRQKNPGRMIQTQDLRDRVEDAITNAIIESRNIVVDAIMSGGKTYGTFKAAEKLDTPVSYFAPRLDMYDQAVEYCKEIGIPEEEIKVLPSMKRQCPTWDGKFGEEWELRVKAQYYAGAQPKVIHEMNDDIPCREKHEHGDEQCPYEAMWDFEPEDYKVIIGHYKHAHVTHVTAGRTCVFDEEPTGAFETTIEGKKLVQSVNTFLNMTESPPVSDFDELLRVRDDDSTIKKCMRWFNQMKQADEFDFSAPDSAGVIQRDGEDYHGYAPHAVYAILKSSPVAEGSNFERGFMPSGFSGSLFFTTSEQRGEYYVQFRESPDLEYANAVLALDGTPMIDDSMPTGGKCCEWAQALGIQIEHNRILTNAERRQYIRNTLRHRYVQVSDSANPYSSGKYNNMTEDAALCAAAKELYGDGDLGVVFTPKKVADEYTEAGFKTKALAKEIDYPGNLRGTDKYGEERLAVQLGSSHHGDHEIRRRSAWLYTHVEVSGKGMDRDYGSELANSILHQMRENQTAQNVMRVGRDGKGATVVLKTAAIPDYFPIEAKGSVVGWPEGMKEVMEAWVDLFSETGRTTTLEVADIADHEVVSVGTRQVRNALNSFDELGFVEKDSHPEDGRKNVYSDSGLASVDPDERAEVELPDVDWPEIEGAEKVDDEIRLTNVYTSDFDISTPDPNDSPETGLQVGIGDVTGDMDRGDPPTE